MWYDVGECVSEDNSVDGRSMMFILKYIPTIPCDFSQSQAFVSCEVCNYFSACSSLVLSVFLHIVEGIYFRN